MVQPPMFNNGSGRFWQLKKALCGLKQAAREGHRALAKLLSDLGLMRCASDPALYVSKLGRCFIFLWVDDLLIFSAKDQLQPLVDKMLTAFEGRDLKELSYVLGMEVTRDRSNRRIPFTNRKLITELLSRFSLCDCKRSPTPLVPKEKIMSLSEDPSLERANCIRTQSLHASCREHPVRCCGDATGLGICCSCLGQAHGSECQEAVVGCPACYEIPAEYD